MATGTYDYQSEFTRRLEARGEVEGRALLLRQIDDRSVRVLTASTVEELFA